MLLLQTPSFCLRSDKQRKRMTPELWSEVKEWIRILIIPVTLLIVGKYWDWRTKQLEKREVEQKQKDAAIEKLIQEKQEAFAHSILSELKEVKTSIAETNRTHQEMLVKVSNFAQELVSIKKVVRRHGRQIEILLNNHKKTSDEPS
jgi:Mg2+ and Co2+ transporter CorA